MDFDYHTGRTRMELGRDLVMRAVDRIEELLDEHVVPTPEHMKADSIQITLGELRLLTQAVLKERERNINGQMLSLKPSQLPQLTFRW